MDDDDSQGRRTKNSTPLGQRDTPRKSLRRVASGTPNTPTPKHESEDKVGGDITVKMEPGQAPKLARSSSKNIPLRPAAKFSDVPDAAPEAKKGYESLDKCMYANKYLGTTDPALECDCAGEWGKFNTPSHFLLVVPNLSMSGRFRNRAKQCLWARLRLHQPCNPHGMRPRLWLWIRLPESTLPT